MACLIRKVEIPEGLNGYVESGPAIGICNAVRPQNAIEIAAAHRLWHLIHTGQPHFECEVKVSELMLESLETFLKNPVTSILTPESIDHPPPYEGVELSFSKASEKSKTLDTLGQMLTTWKRPSSRISEMLLVADEMFTNAIYNAPYVTFAKNGPGAARTQEFGDADGLRPAKIFLGRDNDRIVLGCEDGYGTLNPKHVITRLHNCFSVGARKALNWDTGGAGLGTFMMVRAALAYYVGVQQGTKTVVCCAFPMVSRRAEMVPNLHLSVELKKDS